MPFHQDPLQLDADPRSVHAARQWVASRCAEVEREDLSECAELGISELVTNALLHGGDPITVRMSGTRNHPRFEVTDGSSHPPVVPMSTSDEMEDLLSTFGRGLDIVARCSSAWGATIERAGKVVWFEPSADPQEGIPPTGELVDPGHGRPAEVDEAAVRVPVRLAGVPVGTALGLRRHHQDLRREVSLLSLVHEDSYPLAAELAQGFWQFEHAFPRAIDDAVDEAAAHGVESVDVQASVADTAPPVFRRMSSLLDRADEFCRAERLLSLARSAHQRRFQEWLLGELVSQVEGRPATAWSGRDDRDQA